MMTTQLAQVPAGFVLTLFWFQVHSVGKSSVIQSLEDSVLKRGIFLVDLLYALDPLCINYSFVTPGINGSCLLFF